MEEEGRRLLGVHLDLLKTGTELQDHYEVTGTPMFTISVVQRFPDQFSQYGLLAGMCDVLDRPQLCLRHLQKIHAYSSTLPLRLVHLSADLKALVKVTHSLAYSRAV